MAGTVTRRSPIRLSRGEEVLALWCALTGHDLSGIDEPEREALLARTEIGVLAGVPDAVLVDAGIVARRGRSLPLERWLAAVRVVRPGVGSGR